MQNIADRIIVALDYASFDEAMATVDQLAGVISYFKIGLELMTAEGAPKLVTALHQKKCRVFLDGKFHDIPNTIAKAAREAAKLGVELFNVHASSGEKAMQAAAKEKGASKILAVTILTSMSDAECRKLYGRGVDYQVGHFALTAKVAGIDGVVCSPQELKLLAEIPELGPNFLKVTPGVRPEWSNTNDQTRVMTPTEAFRLGATHIVIGRPITKAVGGPRDAALKLIAEIREGLQ